MPTPRLRPLGRRGGDLAGGEVYGLLLRRTGRGRSPWEEEALSSFLVVCILHHHGFGGFVHGAGVGRSTFPNWWDLEEV